ncbi:MAG: ClpP family protease [Myxococcota bacterium]
MSFSFARRMLFTAVIAAAFVWLPAPVEAKEKVPSRVTWSNRTIELNGSISRQMIQSAQSKLLKFDEKSHEPVWIRLNSGGGSVDAGLILIDTMQAVESPVYCVVESKAYSMAAIILTFCERRYALDHATIMLHEASYGTAGEDPSIRSRLDFLTRYLDLLHVEIAKKLNMRVDVYRAKIRDAWWLMAHEAKKAGVIDEVISHIDYVTPATEQSEVKTTVKSNHTQHEAPAAPKQPRIKKRR